ncbi:acetylxylan esterase [Egicoccus sp. AB-alg2]|uniref:acetylxylan esterase n=1 Tax=Egicoccus sp. AB-alg2 TaxID=3242693 RepID=UPI00359E47BC
MLAEREVLRVLVDKSLEELWTYRPEVAEPADFDAFWKQQRDAAAAHPLAARFAPAPVDLVTVEVLDVTFAGHGGTPVKGWLLLPRDRTDALPAVVEYVGYGGGRGLPHERLFWSAAGFAHLVMDTRGQGSSWAVGDTADVGDTGAPAAPGFLTRGIADPATHYFTRLFVDAARAVDAVRAHPAVDSGRVAVLGGSQGGGLALAAAHLAEQPAAVSSQVPFLAHFRRAVEVTDALPYGELSRYCRTHRDRADEVFATLSYLDVVNHARRAQAPALFSVGLADTVCPPSTVFAAFHAYAGDKDIRVYPFNEHEGGGAHHVREELTFLREVLT